MANLETIDQTTLTHLVEARAVRGAEVVGQKGGWGVVVEYGMSKRVLAVRRGHPRVFRNFDTVVALLKQIGLPTFVVNAVEFDPVAAKSDARSQAAAERMRRAHAAAEYDKWFREQVQASIDDPRPSIPHEEVKARFAARREALRRRIS